jgi:hypothetical protein
MAEYKWVAVAALAIILAFFHSRFSLTSTNSDSALMYRLDAWTGDVAICRIYDWTCKTLDQVKTQN